MPTHLLLEGADIESVLTELRESHGPDAKIVQAELVRSGGVAGFFAKKRYEVTVELDDEELLASPFDPTPRLTAPEPAEPARQDFTSFAAFRPGTTTSAAPADSGIDALLNAAEDGDSTHIASAEIRSAATPSAEIASAEIRSAATASEVAAPPVGAALRELAIQGWHRPVSTEGTAFSDVLSSLTDNLTEHGPVTTLPAPAPMSPTPPAPTPPLPFSAFGFPLPTPRVEPEDEQVTTTPLFDEIVAEDLQPTRDRLAALGVPGRLLAEVRSAETLLALRDVVESLGTPALPTWRRSATRGGALVVVVGSWAVARHAVLGLVDALEIEPQAILSVATPTDDEVPADQTVRSHAAAIELVRRTRQSHDAAILVVDPGQTIHSAARVAQLVAALEPQSVVVAADAGAQLGLSLTALDALEQAEVDADTLALHGLAEAERPAAAFEVPLPIGWVDGAVPTRGSWIGLLMDRLAEPC